MAELKNVVIDGVFSETNQVNMADDTPYEKPTGCILNLEQATGGENIVVRNVFAKTLGTAFNLGKNVQVEAENIHVETLGAMAKLGEGCRLTLDGEEV